MKPLILILLAATAVQAQSLADIARQERERQARVQSTRVITTEDVKRLSTGQTGTEPSTSADEAAPAPSAPAAPAPAAPAAPAQTAKPVVDPMQKYNDAVAELRTRIRQLQDQETATQLQINEATNRVFAPVTSQALRAQAQTDLAEAQKRLTEIRAELASTRTRLQQMEAEGPPKP